MKDNSSSSRRTLIKSSVLGLMAVSIPGMGFAKKIIETDDTVTDKPHIRYPAITDDMVSAVVGASHSNLDRVKELVNLRPELSRATWDWAFGDFETALGAASHVGRRDIAEFLMSKGARPDIFTYAMFGAYDAVKAMIETTPGIQTIAGPHGISLLRHAKNGLRNENISAKNKEDSKKLVDYLEQLGNADMQEKYIDYTEAEGQKYLGDYKYGDGPEDGFSVKMNMRKMLSLGKLGAFGGGLYKKGNNVFTYNGVPSVEVRFTAVNDKVVSLTIYEPDLSLTAKKI
ncbi:MAG: hypothetical protein WBP16_07975 [Ferruginibacter sp.]